MSILIDLFIIKNALINIISGLDVKETFCTSHNNALTLRHGGQRQGACVPWVAGCICFEAGAGKPHPFTGSGAPPGSWAMPVRLSGVVSANPLCEIRSVCIIK